MIAEPWWEGALEVWPWGWHQHFTSSSCGNHFPVNSPSRMSTWPMCAAILSPVVTQDPFCMYKSTGHFLSVTSPKLPAPPAQGLPTKRLGCKLAPRKTMASECPDLISSCLYSEVLAHLPPISVPGPPQASLPSTVIHVSSLGKTTSPKYYRQK